MRAFGATRFAASHLLLAKVYLRLLILGEGPGAVELRLGEDHEAAQLMVVEIPDRIQQIAVEGHQATERGANSLVVDRRSVSVQPWGGVIRSAWFEHSE
jgi:hypothetical protein